MGSRANYFKLGLFVLTALAIAVVGIMALGAGAFFREETIAETYIDESVQGLEVGAAVRLRGVLVGKVTEISFVRNAYPSSASSDGENLDTEIRYVLVRFALYPEKFCGSLPSDLALILRREIQERGLRCRLASAGITGMLYLEVDYVSASAFPLLKPDWEPEHYYIPSAPSTIMRFSESVENLLGTLSEVLKKIEKLSIEPVVEDLSAMILSLKTQIDEAKVGEISAQLQRVLTGLEESNAALQTILASPEIGQFLEGAAKSADGAARTIEQTNALVERGRDKVNLLLERLLAVSNQIGGATEKLDALLSANDLPESAAYLKSALKRFDHIVARQQQSIETIIENIRRITDDFREVGRTARDNPPQLLFGAPPAPTELEEKP